VFTAESEDMLVAMAVEHARKFHDLNLLEQYDSDELLALVRRENETYWARIDTDPLGYLTVRKPMDDITDDLALSAYGQYPPIS
jgi:hypothetical protein